MNDQNEFRLSAWGIRNPVPVTVLFIALVVMGLFSYFKLPVKNFPNVEFPAVAVSVTRNGAAPAEMESQITRQVENSMAGLANVQNIASTITQGSSTTVVQFYLGTDLQKALDDVRTRTDQARADLPRDVDPPLVRRLEIDDQPIITYAVSAPALSIQELSWFIEDTIARTLQAAPGVAQVRRVGGVDREINVVVDPDRMAAQGLTADNVNQALAVASLDAPGGRVTVGGREQTLRILGAAVTVEQIRNITVPTGGGRSVRLSDVADVGDGSAEVRSFALLNGQPVVGFQVSKVKDASEITTENGVSAAIDKLLEKHEGISITKILSRVDQTRAGFIATWHTLLEGMLLAALVVFVFLRDWRSTLITAIAMPVSLIPTFFFMSVLGFSLNMVTLLGLTLVIGILVDDAIVEIENIEKRVYRGLRPYDAAIQGADQIALGRRGDHLRHCRHVLSGRFHARDPRTVLPRVRRDGDRCGAVLAVGGPPADAADGGVLPRSETGEKTAGASSAVSARADVGARPSMGVGRSGHASVLPLHRARGAVAERRAARGNPNFLSVAIEAPPGSTIGDMRAVVTEVHDLLAAQPEAESVFAQVGNGGTSGGPGGFTSSAGVTKERSR
jgi:HAE1 family hydrophobic/amphiphilic exporter-1